MLTIYMNGTVSRLKAERESLICEIIVPSKEQKKKMTTAEIVGMGKSDSFYCSDVWLNIFK